MQQSDLLSWFQFHEVQRSTGPGGALVQLKPGGPDQQHIDLDVWLDNDQVVQRGVLLLARQWAGAGRLNPFAIDLIKSFLRTLGQGIPQLEQYAATAEGLLATSSDRPIISAAPPEPGPFAPPAPDPDEWFRGGVLGTGNGGATMMPHEWRLGVTSVAGSHLLLDVSYRRDDCLDPLTDTPRAWPFRLPDCFLEQTDLPAGMTRQQDERGRGPDPGDVQFARFGGVNAGLARWQGATFGPIDRLIDIRWLFPTAEAALAYHRATLTTNAENCPAMASAPSVGTACVVAEGGSAASAAMQAIMGTAEPFVSFFYLFTTGPVVVKLYANQAPRGKLTLEGVHAIAACIPPSIVGTLGAEFGLLQQNQGSPAVRPFWRRLFRR